MTVIRIQALGPFHMWQNENAVLGEAWPTHKSKLLFKILLTERGYLVSADQLIEYLWPDLSLKQAKNNLWVTVSQVRHVLQPELPQRTPSDPQQARQLLAEAGYPGGNGFPAVEAVAFRGPSADAAIGHFQTQWLETLGIEIIWKRMEWTRYLDRLHRERPAPHLWLMIWSADYPDPDSFLRTGDWRSTGGWRNEAYDGLVEGARRVMDQGERMRMYRQADKILVEEAPIIPLAYWRTHLLVKPWVSRYPTPASGIPPWKDVIIEPH